MKLSDKLIALRKETGWSQKDLAEKLDVSRQAISRWENGTALPDASNIVQISKLFNITADYLLNDEYESEPDMPATNALMKNAQPAVQKKKYSFLCFASAIGIVALSCFAIIEIQRNTHNAHTHSELIRVIENEVAATCTEQGSYDEVIYCKECDTELLRTHISTGMPTHQFQDEKCIVCGEEQRARD